MFQFFDEKPDDIVKRHEALEKTTSANPPVDFDSIAEQEVDELNSYQEKIYRYKSKQAELLFSTINPLNLPLDKLKDQLEAEAEEIRIDLASLQNTPDKFKDWSNEEASDLYDKYANKLRHKVYWIGQIENFLLAKDGDAFQEARDYIREKWNNLKKSNPQSN